MGGEVRERTTLRMAPDLCHRGQSRSRPLLEGGAQGGIQSPDFPLCPVGLAEGEADFDLPCFPFACLPKGSGGGGRRVSLASPFSDIQAVEFTAKMKPNVKSVQLL